jgi:hypothetical protein
MSQNIDAQGDKIILLLNIKSQETELCIKRYQLLRLYGQNGIFRRF